MCRGACVLLERRRRPLRGEDGREPFVERFDGHVEDVPVWSKVTGWLAVRCSDAVSVAVSAAASLEQKPLAEVQYCSVVTAGGAAQLASTNPESPLT